MNLKQILVCLIIIILIMSGCAFVGPETNSITLNLDFSSRLPEMEETYHIAVMIVEEDDPEFLKFSQLFALESSLIFGFRYFEDANSVPSYNLSFENINLNSIYFPTASRKVFIVNTASTEHQVIITGIMPGKRKRVLIKTHMELENTLDYWESSASPFPTYLGYGVQPKVEQLNPSISSLGDYVVDYQLFISDAFEISGNTVYLDLRNANSKYVEVTYTYFSGDL